MDKMFKKKTLLVLGSNVGSDDIVKYAKENGAYTIVADYYPVERSYAKRFADEAVLISTADLDALGRMIEERHINGVLAGVSEFNLLQAMELSERYNLPFYCSREQWDMVENKAKFRKLCEINRVPCPKTYYKGTKMTDSAWAQITYPAVIKPVDAATSAGVHICMTEQELKAAEEDALSHSSSRQIIIEEYVYGDEFTAHYTICNGVPTLSCIDNRYPVKLHNGNVTSIPIARVYPSSFLTEYIEQVNRPMINLCYSLGIQNGVFFVQGLYNKDDGFHIFEAGLRSAGEAPYRILREVNGVDYMHILVEQALLGECVTYPIEKEDPTLHGKYCGVISFASKGGVVGKIEGLNETVSAVNSIVDYESRYPIGSQTPDGDTLRQLMIRFVLICESKEQMIQDIAYINEHVNVLDIKGDNMAVKMDPEILFL